MASKGAQRRREWLKANGPCKGCGTWDELQIDHVDPDQKEYEIAPLWNGNLTILRAELAKCQVLCKECHWRKHRAPLLTGTDPTPKERIFAAKIALDQAKQELAAALAQAYDYRLSYSHIAEVLGITKAGAQQAVARARDQMSRARACQLAQAADLKSTPRV